MRTLSTGVRRAWLATTIDRIQATASQPVIVDMHDACVFLHSWAASLPIPKGRSERLILRYFLVGFAAQWGAALHHHVHVSTGETQCPFVPDKFLPLVWKNDTSSPVDRFRTWVDRFCAEFDRLHPRSAAQKVAAIIRREYRQPLTVDSLAKRANITARQLSRTFRRAYGMRVRAYHQLVRLAHATDRVRDEKIAMVAGDVGFRSKKSFYRAFKQLTGMLPSEFRRLSSEDASRIVRAIRQKF